MRPRGGRLPPRPNPASTWVFDAANGYGCRCGCRCRRGSQMPAQMPALPRWDRGSELVGSVRGRAGGGSHGWPPAGHRRPLGQRVLPDQRVGHQGTDHGVLTAQSSVFPRSASSPVTWRGGTSGPFSHAGGPPPSARHCWGWMRWAPPGRWPTTAGRRRMASRLRMSPPGRATTGGGITRVQGADPRRLCANCASTVLWEYCQVCRISSPPGGGERPSPNGDPKWRSNGS